MRSVVQKLWARRERVRERMWRSRGAVWAVPLSPSSARVARFAWGYGSEASPMLVDFLQKTKKKDRRDACPPIIKFVKFVEFVDKQIKHLCVEKKRVFLWEKYG